MTSSLRPPAGQRYMPSTELVRRTRALTHLAKAHRTQSQAIKRRILFVTTEMADFVKAGGLGDVSAALPRALARSQDVRVLIPGYRQVLASCRQARLVGRIAPLAQLPACDLLLARSDDGLAIYILRCPALYERDGSPYVARDGEAWADNTLRFATLSHAAAEVAAGAAGLDWQPQLLHLNDWPCALSAGYLRWRGLKTPCLLTIHNLAYQGLFEHTQGDALGIPREAHASMDFYGQLSFLQAGIHYASRINTVSRHYAEQITLPPLGCGLDSLLLRRADQGHLSGIVNGIDVSWDPRKDRHLHCHFGIDQWRGKQANKHFLQRHFGLHRSRGPLFAVVSRLVQQKGLDLVCEVAPQIVAAGGQLCVIGSGEASVEQAVGELGQRYPGHVATHVGFRESLARRMFAGSDFLLMPSRFEPCGLSQMYAQRFGSLPLAHATGGLIDTIDDGVTGFLFPRASADGLRACIERAFRVYRCTPLLYAMRRAAMLIPMGWDAACEQYLGLYDALSHPAPTPHPANTDHKAIA
ncbi:glycogen synthase GlgA [Oleiagrimonas sp. C23AA]|uniref:glycogen synthase GlgA n=1 Tax=Oleiagrimonas sp. C23AA TaxID=2719047 RepID=UPI001F0DA970|nr:glycogen synthase GlgA [Oleiagrimonas sp. C23AA]